MCIGKAAEKREKGASVTNIQVPIAGLRISKAGNHAHQLGGVDVAGSVPIGCGKTTDYG